MPERRLRVLVVDDHRLFAETLAAALRASGLDVEVADLSGRAALISSVCDNPPDLVMLDLELGEVIGDGATLVRPFVQAGSRVLLVSAATATDRVGPAIEQGALGHVAKASPFLDLLRTVIDAAQGRSVMPPESRRQMMHELQVQRERMAAVREPFERLTIREQQVLRALADGRTVAQIAAEWFVSESTVRSQVRGILTQLGAGSQLEAVAHALRSGWLMQPGGPAPRSGELAFPRQR